MTIPQHQRYRIQVLRSTCSIMPAVLWDLVVQFGLSVLADLSLGILRPKRSCRTLGDTALLDRKPQVSGKKPDDQHQL
jgi:hypothetical protein